MPEDFDRRRILVVDDEERMVRFIRMNLEHDGFQVSEAFNGKQAIQKLRDVTPDLILLDVMMPDIDGFEVLETIREGSNVPVIMLTAKGEEDDRVRGLELGADDYITKPFSPREMVSRVKAVIRRTESAGGSRPLAQNCALCAATTFGTGRAFLVRCILATPAAESGVFHERECTTLVLPGRGAAGRWFRRAGIQRRRL
jgi:Response regulators consisting of a CheY-like receiver domain and a winged-helix DNA-binding domain